MGQVGGAYEEAEVGVALGRGAGEKQKAPYLTHHLKGEANVVEFCPFEDCLGIGHGNGFTSIIVPGQSMCGVSKPVKNVQFWSRVQLYKCMVTGQGNL